MQDMRKIGSKVYRFLEDYPETRDDDRLLLAFMWEEEINPGDDFIFLLRNGLVSHPETVTRVRRKLQEKNVSLRGEKWAARHHLEEEVVEQLTFFDHWKQHREEKNGMEKRSFNVFGRRADQRHH